MLQAKTPPVTIQDVAALSICTVSRPLRNLPDVSARSCAKVGDAAGGLERVASRLAGGRAGSIATISWQAADQEVFAAKLLIERLDRSGLPNPPTCHALETKLMARKCTRSRRCPAPSPAA